MKCIVRSVIMDENKKQEAMIYRLQNCMLSETNFQNFIFRCQLRNLTSDVPQIAVNYCNKCACFKDTNEDIDGGFLG